MLAGARRCRDEDAAHVDGAGGSGGGHALSHNGDTRGESVANGGGVAAADAGGESVDVSDSDDDDAREAIDPAQRVKVRGRGNSHLLPIAGLSKGLKGAGLEQWRRKRRRYRNVS